MNNIALSPQLNHSYIACAIENISPLDQFEIRDLLSLDVSIFNIHIALTNISFYLTIGALIVITLNILATNYNRVISNK
jgi:F-type H+-transporting ATPase subunit a